MNSCINIYSILRKNNDDWNKIKKIRKRERERKEKWINIITIQIKIGFFFWIVVPNRHLFEFESLEIKIFI